MRLKRSEFISSSLRHGAGLPTGSSRLFTKLRVGLSAHDIPLDDPASIGQQHEQGKPGWMSGIDPRASIMGERLMKSLQRFRKIPVLIIFYVFSAKCRKG
jgi:hypothetical protein